MRLKPEAVAAAGIETKPVLRGPLQTYRDFPGTVQPNENKRAEITPLVRGRVRDVYVDMGQEVKGGTLLARLYSRELGLAQSSYLKARAKLREAEQVFERARDLLNSKAISLAELQKREAELLSVRAETRETRDRLELLGMREEDIQRLEKDHLISSYVPIRAPFAGRVIARDITKGEVVETSDTLFVVADLSTLWLIVNIPGKDIPFILHSGKKGGSVEIQVSAYPHEVFHGQITYIGDVLDPATRTMRIRAEVPNQERRLRPEMFATVRIYSDPEPDVLTIPSAAIQQDRGETVVFVQVDPQQFERRPVKLGAASGELVKLLDGLREGEHVVVSGSFVLKSELLRQQQTGPVQ
ncbi:MAG: efflux RND transporter periplasmic adaptor subunit [Nitrospiraceae bacterium]